MITCRNPPCSPALTNAKRVGRASWECPRCGLDARKGNTMEPSENEVNDVLNRCADQTDEGGSRWPGMSYEQGVEAAIRWMQGDGENPMDE